MGEGLIDKVTTLLKAGKGRDEIKKATGLSMWKTRDLIAKSKALMDGGGGKGPSADDQIKNDLKINKLQSDNSTLESKYKKLLSEVAALQDHQKEILEMSQAIQDAKPDRFRICDTKKSSQSTAFMIASDWHIEETVLPCQVDGLNEYNLTIAAQRVEKFFQNGLKLVDMCRTKSTIDSLVLGLIGDEITGYIHEELVETNSLSPTQASLRAYEMIVGGIEFLLEHGKFKQIIVPCCHGNHGRTTIKPRVSTSAQNSYEWLMYSFLLRHYEKHPVVSIKLTEGYFNYLDVYDRTIRFHHGDGVKYQGGVGGVHIPLRKAIAQWNKAKPAYLDVLGHWHSRQSATDYVLNGSLIGYNAYSIKIKSDFEPPQQSFFLIHPKRGKTVEAPIFVN